MSPPAPQSTSPPKQTPTYEQAAAAVAAAAQGAGGGAAGAAGAVAGAEAAGLAAATTPLTAILDLARFRWNVMFDPSGPVAEAVKAEYPGRDFKDVMELVDERERGFEREFRRKMRKRLEADIPEALAEPDPDKRADKLAKIFKREMRYTAMREEAILSRAMGAIEADMLQTLSPKGAYWKLSPHVKEHTLDCLAMGEKFWPWSVLRKVQPPLHYGCPCYLLGLDEVVEMGLMSEDQVPDEADARARYGRIADKVDDLRGLDEAAVEELYEAAYENLLEEAPRGARRPLRWAKGFVKGGQFRPTRGSSPGARVLDFPESPTRQRGAGRGRWTWVNGTYTKIPEADAWTKTVGERTYHSPPGGTNLYVNGRLANEPGQPSEPAERVKMSAGTVSVPPEVAAKADTVREGLRSDAAPGRGVPPISVGDGPSAILGLADAGFYLESARPGGKHRRTLTFKASSGTLTVDVGDKGTVADLVWEPAREVGDRVALDRPAFNWDEHASDALAYADELGSEYGANVKVPQIFPDESLHDHAGTHLWSGEIKVGADTPKDIDRAGRKRQAGKGLSDDEKRGVYASYWVTGHEVAHGVNPIQPQYFSGANANLEEALAEEMGHKLALDRLARHGQYDVIEWRFRNPDALAVRGVYPNERHALARVLDEAGVPEAARGDVIERMAFRMRPESRLQYLATLVAARGDGDVEAARGRVERMLANPDKAPADFRSVINPRQLRKEAPARYGSWDYSGKEPRWSPDEDALAAAVAGIQGGPSVMTVGDQVPVAKYADGSFGVGDPHGSSSDELTFAPDAVSAAETALGRSDYARIHSGGYKADEGSAPVSPAQSASDNAMLYFAQHSGALAPASPGVAPSRFQRANVAYERDLLVNDPEKMGLPADKPIPAQFGIVNERQAEEIGRLVNEAALVVRMDSKGFSRFLEDGQMKPSPERADVPVWRRTRVERDRRYGLMVGEDTYMQTRMEAEGELFGAHPVYGYFRSPNTPFNTTTEDSSVFYGNVVVEMKPQVKDRTTWTIGDSLNAQRWLVPSPVGQSSPLSVPPLGPFSPRDYSEVEKIDDLFDRKWPVLPEAAAYTPKERGNVSMVAEDAGGYAEAQIFGARPTKDDIARVIFVAPSVDERSWDPDRSDWSGEELETERYGPTPEQERALDEAGIPWEFVDAGEAYGVVREGETPYNAPDQTDWKATRRRAVNKPVPPPEPGDTLTPRAVEDALPGAEIRLDPNLGADFGGFAFVSPEGTPARRLRKREDGRWVELEGPDQGKARTTAWVARETQNSPRSKGSLAFAEWVEYPQRPADALPDPPQSPGWFTPKSGSSWIPKKNQGKPRKPPKPPKPKVIGGSDARPVTGGPFRDYNPVRLTMDKPAGGSNGAMWAKDSAGNRWLVKTYRGNEDRIATELVSNRIYDLLGARVADAGVIEVDGRTALTYRALDGAPRNRVFHTEGPSEAMGEHYMADALLANWDFAGLTDDNVLWDAEGNPIRIDQGGTLEFRAMGQPKDFGPVPSDVWTMLRKGQAKRASKVTEPQMRAQAAQIAETLTPEVIDRLMDAAPFRDREMRERVRENLKARVDWMGAYADGDVDVPRIPEGAAARDEFRALQAEFEVFPEELAPLNFYSRGGALPVQRHLRSREPVEAADPNVAGAVQALDAILKDAKTVEDVIVYVPVEGEAPDGLIGRTVSERGFVHATTDREAAMAEGSMVRLLVPAGSHVVDLREVGADLPGDAPEIVVRRGSRMKFTGRAEDGSLEATLMPPARPYAPPKPKGGPAGQMGLPGLDVPPKPPQSPGVGAPLPFPGDLPGPLKDAETSDYLHALWTEDPEDTLATALDLDTVTSEQVKKWRKVVYDHTQESMKQRGLPESFTAYRYGELWDGPTNFSLSPITVRRNGIDEPQRPYIVDREDVVVDSNAFFPDAFVGENEIVLRNGTFARPAPQLPPVATGQPVKLQMWHGSNRSAIRKVRPGFFVTTDKNEADDYGWGGSTLPVEADFKNPKVYDGEWGPGGRSLYALSLSNPEIQELREQGHDALIVSIPFDNRDPTDAVGKVPRYVAYVLDPASVKVLPEPPQSPGTATGRAAAATMDEAEARETLEAVGIRVGKPGKKGAGMPPVHKADPTFLGTLAYLADLYPETSRYLTEVNFASSATLPDSPVEGGPRAGRFAGGIRRSAKAGTWQAQVIKNSAWKNPDAAPADNHRAKLVYNDLHAAPDNPGAYLDDFDEGSVVSVKGEHWRHEGELWYRIPSKWAAADEKVLDDDGLAISLSSDDLHRRHSQGHVVGEDDPTHTPAHEFAHGLAGAWTVDPEQLPEWLNDEWIAQLRRNPAFVEPVSYADLWNITSQLRSNRLTARDIGWRVFLDNGITMDEIAAISRYAKSEPSEAFAELFSAHYLGLLPPEVDEKFEALLEKMRTAAVPAGAGV